MFNWRSCRSKCQGFALRSHRWSHGFDMTKTVSLTFWKSRHPRVQLNELFMIWVLHQNFEIPQNERVDTKAALPLHAWKDVMVHLIYGNLACRRRNIFNRLTNNLEMEIGFSFRAIFGMPPTLGLLIQRCLIWYLPYGHDNLACNERYLGPGMGPDPH